MVKINSPLGSGAAASNIRSVRFRQTNYSRTSALTSVTTKCPRCRGTGDVRRWVSGIAPMDPDATQAVKVCGACDGGGSLTVRVEEDDPDLIHDAAVDLVEACGFFVEDER